MCPFELSTGDSAQLLCDDPEGWMGGGGDEGPEGMKVHRGEDTCTPRADSLHCRAETVTESRLTQLTAGQANKSER